MSVSFSRSQPSAVLWKGAVRTSTQYRFQAEKKNSELNKRFAMHKLFAENIDFIHLNI